MVEKSSLTPEKLLTHDIEAVWQNKPAGGMLPHETLLAHIATLSAELFTAKNKRRLRPYIHDETLTVVSCHKPGDGLLDEKRTLLAAHKAAGVVTVEIHVLTDMGHAVSLPRRLGCRAITLVEKPDKKPEINFLTVAPVWQSTPIMPPEGYVRKVMESRNLALMAKVLALLNEAPARQDLFRSREAQAALYHSHNQQSLMLAPHTKFLIDGIKSAVQAAGLKAPAA